jgi:hypothetical protein
MLHSDNVPSVDYSPPIKDLFYYFHINWDTLFPVIAVLGGIGIGFFFLKILKDNFWS